MSWNVDQELQQVFGPAMRKDERLLWAGRPKPGSLDYIHLFPTIFIAFWLAMVAVIGGTGTFMTLNSEAPALVSLPFFIIPFLMVAFGVGFLIFSIAGLTAPSRQLYAVTNKRAIIYGGRFERSFHSKLRGQISDIRRSGNNEVGTLTLTQGGEFGLFAAFMMMGAPLNKFYNIPKPAEVEALIFDNLFD